MNDTNGYYGYCERTENRVVIISPRIIIGADGREYIVYRWEGAEVAIIEGLKEREEK